MNDPDSNELLKNELSDLRRMATHLQESLKNCASLPENPPVEDLWSESVEAFMSRFARTADLLAPGVRYQTQPRPHGKTILGPTSELLTSSQHFHFAFSYTIHKMTSHDFPSNLARPH
jgi:hypothetical protein